VQVTLLRWRDEREGHDRRTVPAFPWRAGGYVLGLFVIIYTMLTSHTVTPAPFLVRVPVWQPADLPQVPSREPIRNKPESTATPPAPATEPAFVTPAVRPVRQKRPSQTLRDSPPSSRSPSPKGRTHECPDPTCRRVFARAEHLNRHMRVHTQEKRTCQRTHKGKAMCKLTRSLFFFDSLPVYMGWMQQGVQ
jgi:hypothetical protein